MDNTEPVPIIDIKKLTKRYKGADSDALHGLSLHVNRGEVYGFLGANGAGKSTTIRTLLNFLQPTSGTALICGLDIVKNNVQIKHYIGYLAGDVALYDKLTGKQFLNYMIELHPLEHAAYLHRLVKDFNAELNKPLGTLSKGNRQKIGVIQAMMHEPEVLILDEPTVGLDPLMQEVFFDHAKEAKKRGASIFFSSHNLAEVQRICDRIGFINKGKLIREHSLEELAQSAAHTFDLIFKDHAPFTKLGQIKHARLTSGHTPNMVSISVPAGSLMQFFAVLSEYPLEQFNQREVNLGEEFMNFYREASNGKS